MARNIQTQHLSTGKGIVPIQPVAGSPNRRGLRLLRRQFLLQACLLLLSGTVLTLVDASSLTRATSDLSTINDGSVLSINTVQAMTQYVEEH